MTWNTNRRAELPSNWAKIRQQVFKRDNWTCVDCGHHNPSGLTLECDHTGHPLDHRIEHLTTRCGPKARNCHGRKTAHAAVLARSTKRPAEKHPGLKW